MELEDRFARYRIIEQLLFLITFKGSPMLNEIIMWQAFGFSFLVLEFFMIRTVIILIGYLS